MRPSSMLFLSGGTLGDGRTVDITVDQITGTIVEVAPHNAAPSLAGSNADVPPALLIDCVGCLVTTTAVEPHAHLDKAYSSPGSRAGSLREAIAKWQQIAPTIRREQVVQRATTTIETLVRRGITAVRTHVDVGSHGDLSLLDGVLDAATDVRDRGIADVQVVALLSPPYTGVGSSLASLHEALERGAQVVGGAPHLDDDPRAATNLLVDAAVRWGVPLDLHMDESIDPSVFSLPDLIDRSTELPSGAIVASHCVSLASQPLEVQHRIADELQARDISVTVMPDASLFTFGWDVAVCPPRGLAPADLLVRAGVTVAGGGDNVQDPFVPISRLDPLRTAGMLVMAAHLTPETAWHACTTAARHAIGLPPVSIMPGAPADLLVVRGHSLLEAMASASEHRIVIKAGRVVARTTVDAITHPALSAGLSST